MYLLGYFSYMLMNVYSKKEDELFAKNINEALITWTKSFDFYNKLMK